VGRAPCSVQPLHPERGLVQRHDLTDAEWARVEPLLPGRGPGGTRRRFVAACLYVPREGCSWRALPAEYGHGNAVWRRHARWCRAGVWGRVVDALRDPDDAVPVLDATTARAHPDAAGAGKETARRRSGTAPAGSAPRPTRR
jgi:putative transposase